MQAAGSAGSSGSPHPASPTHATDPFEGQGMSLLATALFPNTLTDVVGATETVTTSGLEGP
jgi:hypothetical protein